MWRYLRNILQLIISPDNGWKDIKENRDSDKDNPQKLFLAMATIASVSNLLKLFHRGHMPALQLSQISIIVFVSLLAAYFLGIFTLNCCRNWFKSDANEITTVKFISYSTSLLSLQFIIQGLLPISMAMLQLWPLYVIVVMWRGMPFLGIEPRHTPGFLFATTISIIVPVQLIIWVFTVLMMI